MALLTDERIHAVRAASLLGVAVRAANVVLLPDDAPADLRPEILRSANFLRFRFKIGPDPEATHSSAVAPPFLNQIRQILGQPEREVLTDIPALL